MTEPTAYALRVLEAVRRIPRGRVMSYGDVAEWMGEGSPRAVGRVLFGWGGDVPWHRVLMADGSPAPRHTAEQLALLSKERVALTADGRRVDMRHARWNGR